MGKRTEEVRWLEEGERVGWTKAEYDQCPELAGRLHTRILDLEDALAAAEQARDALQRERDDFQRRVEQLHVSLDRSSGRAEQAYRERDALRQQLREAEHRPLEEHPAFAGYKALAEQEARRAEKAEQQLEEANRRFEQNCERVKWEYDLRVAAEQQLEQLREAGNRLAVVAQECHDKLLEATGSADGWKVIEDWWAALAVLEKGEE